MHEVKDMLWTWLLPDLPDSTDREEWIRHGGKWIVFDRRERIVNIAERLAPFIDTGKIKSAKYWNEDPSAICVYSFDRDREETWHILKRLRAGESKVWEYDYACDKNLQRPLDFAYSWFSKFRTILQSYGIAGTVRLIREVLRPR